MMLPIGLDWIVIQPAVRMFFDGQNPYLFGENFAKVYEPFWTYLFLAPFALAPFWVGRVLLFIVSILTFGYTAYRLGANRWQFVLFMTSASVIGCLNNGNLDWLVTAGLWMPPQIGLFFVLIKPQVGFAVALYWMYSIWRESGWRETLRVFAPVTVAYLLSFWMYGFWMAQLDGMNANPENMSAFPYSVPIGLLLVYISIRDRDKNLSSFSSPLLAPYASQFSYSVSLLSLFNRPALFLLAWILLWLPVLARYLL